MPQNVLPAHAVVTAPGAAPQRYLLFLHGILGSGANFRTFAKDLASAAPDWGAVLVDLRLHGDSRGASPPHTVGAAAADLVELEAALPGPVRGALGHSFGGKVALAYARDRADRPLEQLFVVDATPSVRDPSDPSLDSTRHVVDLLRDLPDDFEDRRAFVAWIEARGVTRAIAMWLAMNVRPLSGTARFVFRLDVSAIRELLDDYLRLDLWSVLEAPGPMKRHLIVGGASSTVDAADRARAARCPNTTVDVIEGAGHWVHVDDPIALRETILRRLA